MQLNTFKRENNQIQWKSCSEGSSRRERHVRDLREIELSTLYALPTGPFIHNVFTKRKKLDVSIEAEFNTELLRAVRRRRMFTVPIVCEQFLVFPSWCCFLSDPSGVQCKWNFCVQWPIQQIIFRLQILFVHLLAWLLYPTTWEARWLRRDQAVWVRVLAEAIVLCSRTRLNSHSASLHPGV